MVSKTTYYQHLSHHLQLALDGSHVETHVCNDEPSENLSGHVTRSCGETYVDDDTTLKAHYYMIGVCLLNFTPQ
jgi:hypothetical protein